MDIRSAPWHTTSLVPSSQQEKHQSQVRQKGLRSGLNSMRDLMKSPTGNLSTGFQTHILYSVTVFIRSPWTKGRCLWITPNLSLPSPHFDARPRPEPFVVHPESQPFLEPNILVWTGTNQKSIFFLLTTDVWSNFPSNYARWNPKLQPNQSIWSFIHLDPDPQIEYDNSHGILEKILNDKNSICLHWVIASVWNFWESNFRPMTSNNF
jgi:hypothetical protein